MNYMKERSFQDQKNYSFKLGGDTGEVQLEMQFGGSSDGFLTQVVEDRCNCSI